MPHHALDERHALAETLRQTGPAAPTLCGDWTTAQLAAHLVLRERSVTEGLGRFPVQALQRRAEAVVQQESHEPYDELVDLVDAGPTWHEVRGPVPVAWLWAIPAVREQANLLEYVVHHEDVRRAGGEWKPRALAVSVQTALWRKLAVTTRVTLRKVPVGLVLAWPSHGELRTARARRGGPVVTVTGDPVELAMMAFGRIPQARVAWDGAPADIEAVRGADITL